MRADVSIVPAERKHIGRIARHMRAIDALECRAMGREPKAALRAAHTASHKVLTALIDGRPVAMFGVVVDSAIGGEGTVWFLGTDEVYSRGRELLTIGPDILSDFGDSMSRLGNLVSARNDKAIRLLRRWGFQIETEATEVRGEPFLPFVMEIS